VASTVTPSTETLQKNAAQNYEKAREAFGGAQEVQSQLTNMENGFRKLNAAGWSSTGSGAEGTPRANGGCGCLSGQPMPPILMAKGQRCLASQ
jgi:hypothetical protein